MDAVLRSVAAAAGRDVVAADAPAERVEAALGRNAAAVGQSVSTHLLVVPRGVTQRTAGEIPGLLAAAVAPDMVSGDRSLAAAARAEAPAQGPEALLEELGETSPAPPRTPPPPLPPHDVPGERRPPATPAVLGSGRLAELAARLTSERPGDASRGWGLLAARGGPGAPGAATLGGVVRRRLAHEQRALARGAPGAADARFIVGGQGELTERDLAIALAI